MRAPADRPLSALLAILALLATWALTLALIQVLAGQGAGRIAAHADVEEPTAPAAEARP